MRVFLVEQKLVLAERKSHAGSVSPVQWPAMASIHFGFAVPPSENSVVMSVNFSSIASLLYL